MTYAPTNWTDFVPTTTPIKYKISQDSDGDIATDAEIVMVTAYTAGVAVDAANLNKIETELAVLDAEFAPASGHEHDGTDSKQIAYASVTGTPTLGNLAALDITAVTISLPSANWSSSAQTVNATGITATTTFVLCTVDPSTDANIIAFEDAGIKCTAQGAGTLTFKYFSVTAPIVAISVNVVFIP
jgi:uncharacterized membrane protein